MEAPPQTPLKTTKTYMKLFKKLLEIEVEVIHFTNLPTDPPSLDRLADDIEKKFAFFKNLLTAETASHDSTSHDLSGIERKLEELEVEFYQSNSQSDSHSAIVHEDDDAERSSSSLCESCTSKERPVVGNVGNSNWKIYENPAVLYEALTSPSDMFPESIAPLPSEVFQKSVAPLCETLHEAVVPRSEMCHEAVRRWSYLEDDEQVSCCDCEQREQSGGCEKGGRRWWWRITVVLMTVVSTVSFTVYFNSDQHEGLLTPT